MKQHKMMNKIIEPLQAANNNSMRQLKTAQAKVNTSQD